jgi:hypothetical protein
VVHICMDTFPVNSEPTAFQQLIPKSLNVTVSSSFCCYIILSNFDDACLTERRDGSTLENKDNYFRLKPAIH